MATGVVRTLSFLLITCRRTPCMPCLISFRPPSSTTLHASSLHQHSTLMHACTPGRSVPCHLPLFRIDTQCICLALSPLLFPFPPSPFPSSHRYIRHGQDNRSDQGTSKTARQRLPPLSSAVRAYAIAGAEVVVNPSPQHVLVFHKTLFSIYTPPVLNYGKPLFVPLPPSKLQIPLAFFEKGKKPV